MKKRRQQAGQAGEQGFSLIELLIAMVVTLIVCGAVVSLLMQGNRAFQIQPDMTERQQNVRAAMDMIMKDVANAGAGLPIAGMQVFRLGLNGTGPAASVGGNSDELEMLTNDTGRDPLTVCGASGTDVWITPTLPAATVIPAGTPVILWMNNLAAYSIRVTVGDSTKTTGPGTCGVRTHLTVNADVCGAPGNSVAGCVVAQVLFVDLVRYHIAPDPNDATMPVLLRTQWSSGAAIDQIVAQGIEDMQVTYRSGADITGNPTAADVRTCQVTAATSDAPATTIPCLPDDQPADTTGATSNLALSNTTTIEVQVALSARGTQRFTSAAARKAVMTQAADGSFAYRGSLVSRGSPRAALALLPDGRWR